MAQLLVFVRFDYPEEVIEEFIFCKPLELNTTADRIFNMIDEYLINTYISWSKCIGLCTDRAKCMSRKLTGLATKIKKVAPECWSTHCVIHQEALFAKGMPENLTSVLSDAVKVVTFIKARALRLRLFYLMCKDMGDKFRTLLLHTEVRLSFRKICTRLFTKKNKYRN